MPFAKLPSFLRRIKGGQRRPKTVEVPANKEFHAATAPGRIVAK